MLYKITLPVYLTKMFQITIYQFEFSLMQVFEPGNEFTYFRDKLTWICQSFCQCRPSHRQAQDPVPEIL